MKEILFTIPLREGMLVEYKAFANEITGPKKKEYSALLKRFGLKSTRVWYQKIGDKDYVVVVHDTEGDIQDEHLDAWLASTDPFDVWFKDELNRLYECTPDEAHLIFAFDRNLQLSL